jgi:hypothetical protein
MRASGYYDKIIANAGYEVKKIEESGDSPPFLISE